MHNIPGPVDLITILFGKKDPKFVIDWQNATATGYNMVDYIIIFFLRNQVTK